MSKARRHLPLDGAPQGLHRIQIRSTAHGRHAATNGGVSYGKRTQIRIFLPEIPRAPMEGKERERETAVRRAALDGMGNLAFFARGPPVVVALLQ